MSERNSKSVIESLQKNIPELMKKNEVVGLSISLIENGETIWSQGFGFRNKEEKLPMLIDTPIEAASLTKTTFAYLVLKYCEEGLFDLDTPLTEYLSEEYLPNQPNLRFITARHVLSHTTGFPNWRPEGGELEIYFTPGERFSYSGEGYIYLQKAIEEHIGKGIDQLFKERFFDPLNLKSASLLWSEEFDDIAAIGYLRDGKQKNMKPRKAQVAGTLHISAVDYANYMCSLLKMEKTSRYHLNEKSIDEMFSIVVPVSDAGLSNKHHLPKSAINESDKVFWGLGWGLEKNNKEISFWHWGNDSSFHHFVIASREKKSGIVIMSNSEKAPLIWRDILEIGASEKHPGFEWLMSFYF